MVKAQDVSIRIYGHPGFDYFTNRSQHASAPYFRGGPLVLYATSEITDKISVAGELNMHYMSTEGAEAELERMYLRYQFKNYLSFRIGRMYSPIGFWNANYNFGLVLQPNISRPRILNPTHDGGFIQTRETGVQIEGDNIGKANFFYRFLIANGVGKNGGILGTPYAMGSFLSYTAQVGIEPLEGLRLSASASTNHLPVGSATQFDNSFVPDDMNNTMLSGSVSHINFDEKLECIAEYFVNRHDYASLQDHQLHGGLLYAGYRITPSLVPYVFVEYTDFPEQDPYYPAINAYTGQTYSDVVEYNVGLRYRVSSNLVLKGELSALHEEAYGTSYGLKTQVAFSF